MKTILTVLCILSMSAPATAATFVYVSNAEDGDIGMYTLQGDGTLKPGERYKAAATVMPMTVSPDKRVLVAAARLKPFTAYSYAIDRRTGALSLIGAWRMRGLPGTGLLVLSGALSLAAGILVAVDLPSSAAWAIGLLVGVNLVYWGVRALFAASALKALS